MDVRQVAEALRISTRAVWKHVAAGRIPEPVRLGRSTRWRAASVEHFVRCGLDMARFSASKQDQS